MSGHGHVTPNPDGSKARCGGPDICPQCSREAALQRPMTQPLSPAEQRIVERFELAQPAPESWGHPHHWIGTHDHGPVCSVCGMRKPEGGDGELRAEEIARRFHETYERLAPVFGYETRRESAVPWEDVPEQNRRLMVAVCEEVTATASRGMRKPEGGDDELREALAAWLSHAPLLDVDDLLTLPEVAALRARAAAADRVRELADTYAFLGATLHDVPRAQTWAEAATELRTALNGPT